MMVYKLTATQKNLLLGKEYAKDMKFNPVQDANNVWFISIEEVEQCDNPDFAWVKNLTKITFQKKIVQL